MNEIDINDGLLQGIDYLHELRSCELLSDDFLEAVKQSITFLETSLKANKETLMRVYFLESKMVIPTLDQELEAVKKKKGNVNKARFVEILKIKESKLTPEELGEYNSLKAKADERTMLVKKSAKALGLSRVQAERYEILKDAMKAETITETDRLEFKGLTRQKNLRARKYALENEFGEYWTADNEERLDKLLTEDFLYLVYQELDEIRKAKKRVKQLKAKSSKKKKTSKKQQGEKEEESDYDESQEEDEEGEQDDSELEESEEELDLDNLTEEDKLELQDLQEFLALRSGMNSDRTEGYKLPDKVDFDDIQKERDFLRGLENDPKLKIEPDDVFLADPGTADWYKPIKFECYNTNRNELKQLGKKHIENQEPIKILSVHGASHSVSMVLACLKYGIPFDFLYHANLKMEMNDEYEYVKYVYLHALKDKKLKLVIATRGETAEDTYYMKGKFPVIVSRWCTSLFKLVPYKVMFDDLWGDVIYEPKPIVNIDAIKEREGELIAISKDRDPRLTELEVERLKILSRKKNSKRAGPLMQKRVNDLTDMLKDKKLAQSKIDEINKEIEDLAFKIKDRIYLTVDEMNEFQDLKELQERARRATQLKKEIVTKLEYTPTGQLSTTWNKKKIMIMNFLGIQAHQSPGRGAMWPYASLGELSNAKLLVFNVMPVWKPYKDYISMKGYNPESPETFNHLIREESFDQARKTLGILRNPNEREFGRHGCKGCIFAGWPFFLYLKQNSRYRELYESILRLRESSWKKYYSDKPEYKGYTVFRLGKEISKDDVKRLGLTESPL